MGARLLTQALGRTGACRRGEQSTAINSTYTKAQRPHRQGKGAKAQAVGRSRVGWTTKIHALNRRHRPPFRADVYASQSRRRDRCARAARPHGPRPLCTGRQELRCRPAPARAAPSQGRARHPRKIWPQSAQSATTTDAIRDRHLIENAFCSLKISAASQPATTSSLPEKLPIRRPSPPRSRSDSE